MEDRTFDRLTIRALSHATRRTSLGLLLGSALGLVHVAQGEAKKGGKGKGGKGKGKKKKKPACPGQKICNGACIPEGACCTDYECDRCAREVCLSSGVCDCFPELIRSIGVCGQFLNCQSTLTIVNSASECCSEETIVDDGGQLRCAPGKFMCLTPLDCADGGPCRGFMCTDLYNATTGGGC